MKIQIDDVTGWSGDYMIKYTVFYYPLQIDRFYLRVGSIEDLDHVADLIIQAVKEYMSKKENSKNLKETLQDIIDSKLNTAKSKKWYEFLK